MDNMVDEMINSGKLTASFNQSNKYYDIIYFYIDTFTRASHADDINKMFRAARELVHVVGCRFSQEEEEKVLEELEVLRQLVKKFKIKIYTPQQAKIKNLQEIEECEQVREYWHKLMRLVNDYNLLVGTTRKRSPLQAMKEGTL